MRDTLERKLALTLEYQENPPQYTTLIAMYPVGKTSLEILEPNKAGIDISKWIDKHNESLFAHLRRS
jgi:hypothetical protein